MAELPPATLRPRIEKLSVKWAELREPAYTTWDYYKPGVVVSQVDQCSSE